jgi:predicted nucleic acid-binding protein
VSYLLDTNVVSESRRPRPDQNALQWLRYTPSRQLHLSVLTVGELTRGIELLQHRDPSQAAAPQRWVGEIVAMFDGRILPFTTEAAAAWGRLDARHQLPVIDGLIAATALVHHLTVVTRNVKDFERAGVPVLNPFSA